MSTQLNLSEKAINATVDAAKNQIGVDKKWLVCADALRAEGVTVATLTEDKEWRKAFKEEVLLLAFNKTQQAIFSTPTRNLSEEQKVTKKFVQQQLGKLHSRVTSYVRRAEEEETMDDDEREVRQAKELGAWIVATAEKIIDKVQKAPAVSFPAVKVLEDARSMIAWIRGIHA